MSSVYFLAVRYLTRGLLLLVLLLSASCAAKSSNGVASSAAAKAVPDKGAVSDNMLNIFTGEYEASPLLLTHPPKLVAVLPFEGNPDEWEFAPSGIDPVNVLRRGFYNHLSSLPFQDMELRETDKRLAKAGMRDPVLLRMAMQHEPQRVCEVLGVDAVILGKVTHFDRMYFGLASQAAVGCEVRMLDCKTGRELWHASHVSRATSAGVSLTPVGWALDAVNSIWNLREDELLSQTDALFRDMVATIERNIPKEIPQSRLATPILDSPLQGQLREKARLTAEKGPYLVRAAYLIGPGGELLIDPGVELRFAPGASLRVEGGAVKAGGTVSQPVRLVPETTIPGSYTGIVLEHAVGVSLHHVMIQGAVTGLTIAHSAPDLLSCAITDCTQAGLVLKSGAKPVLRCVRFTGNQGMGAVLIEGTDISPQVESCFFEHNEPFQVQSYAPVQLNFSNNYWGPEGPAPDSVLGEIRVAPFLASPPEMGNCHAP